MDKIKSNLSVANRRTKISSNDASDQRGQVASLDPRLRSTTSSSSGQELDLDAGAPDQSPTADQQPRVRSRSTPAHGRVSNDVSASTLPIDSSKYTVFSSLAEKNGISSLDFNEKIWPLFEPYLPDALGDNQADAALLQAVRVMFAKILTIEPGKRERIRNCAWPLADFSCSVLMKVLQLDPFLNLSDELMEAVMDVIPFISGDVERRSQLSGLIVDTSFGTEELSQWLVDNPTAKGAVSKMTEKEGLAPEETQTVWEVLQPILPFPWKEEHEDRLEALCKNIFSTQGYNTNALSATMTPFYAALQPLYVHRKPNEKLTLPLLFWGMPEKQRDGLVRILLTKNNDDFDYICSMALTFSAQDLEKINNRKEAENETITYLTVEIPHEDAVIEERLNAQFTALGKYNQCNRSPNAEHLNDYGGASVQEIFHHSQRTSRYFALDSILLGKAIVDKTRAFSDLLQGLGKRRMRAAYLSDSNGHWNQFGYLVQLGWQSMVSIKDLNDIYKDWANKIIAGGPKSIEIDGINYLLTEVVDNYFKYCYDSFWQENDPLFLYAAGIYKRLAGNEVLEPDAIRVLLSELHWLLVEALPFERGTAAIAEALSDAIWMSHGYIPPEGKCLDLEALSRTQKDFSKVYPMGTKWSLEHQ
jgi:hypothetical protein